MTDQTIQGETRAEHDSMAGEATNEALLNNGVDSGDMAVDAAAPLEPAADTQAPQTRDIILKVPVDVPDQHVDMALKVGAMVQEAMGRGAAVLMFPVQQKRPDGQVANVMGRFLVPLLDPKDVERLLKLAEAITKANVSTMQAMQRSAGDGFAAQQIADRQKENATRDLTAKAEGKIGGIVLATN